MARDLVILPTYYRAEFLYLCLEAISNCPDFRANNVQIRLYQDQKIGDAEQFEQNKKDCEEVISYWMRGMGAQLKPVLRPAHNSYGNSLNVLEAYKRAYQESWRYVYLIEDDVLVSPDFFKFHEAVQKSGDYFCSIAGACDRNLPPPQEVDGFFESQVYASLGVCWKRENLAWTADHAVRGYYEMPTQHVLEHFPNSRYGLWALEQDGLIMRVLEGLRFQTIAWSCVNRARHVGFYGYHRGIDDTGVFSGPLADRIEKHRKAASDKTWLDSVAGFQTDIQPLPSDPLPHWKNLRIVRF